MLGICCLFFIVTGIQFWISDYLQIVLKVDHKKVFIIFALVCITAPVLGVMGGGYYLKHIGGYQNRRALDVCLKISVLAAASGALLPVVDNYIIFVIMMWFLLFFGASIVPGLIGIMLSSAPDNAKEIANSISHLCYNLLGYLPSPFLYGLVCNHTGGATSRYGLAFILLWSYFGVLFLFLAKYFRDSRMKNNIPPQHGRDSPFENNLSNKDTKEDFYELQEDKKHLGEQALTAFYGRFSNI
jgi:predicted MFS family arabinose efflux permease